MKVLRVVVVVFSLALLLGSVMPRSQADDFNKMTKFTFSSPVEVPGRHGTLVLPAGTYVFKLANSTSDRHVVMIYNEDQTRLCDMVIAIPNYRLKPAGETILTFTERPEGSPQAIRAWFYPGDTFGQEFAYPRARAIQLAKLTGEPVPSIPEETAEDNSAMEQAPVKVEQPSGEESEVAEAMPEKSLPKTASDMPLAALSGMLLLGLGIGLRLVSRKFS